VLPQLRAPIIELRSGKVTTFPLKIFAANAVDHRFP
jgi:hypothetical protein